MLPVLRTLSSYVTKCCVPVPPFLSLPHLPPSPGGQHLLEAPAKPPWPCAGVVRGLLLYPLKELPCPPFTSNCSERTDRVRLRGRQLTLPSRSHPGEPGLPGGAG